MRLLLTVLAALFFWGLVVVKFNRFWRRRHETEQGYLAGSIWLVVLLLGISMTLHVDPIQEAVGAATGLNNFGWYLAYLVGAAGFYQGGYLGARAYGVHSEQAIRNLKRLLVADIFLFTGLYGGWLMHTPEWTPRSPRDWPEMLFLVGFFGYAFVAESMSLPPLRRALSRQQEPLIRVRTLLGLATATLALVCCAFKVIYAVLGYLLPAHLLVEIINQMALLSMAGVALFLAPLLIHHRTYLRVYEYLYIGRKLRLLSDLNYLQQQLQAHCPTILWQEPNWWERLTRPDFFIYRTVVSILDSERILSGHLERLARERAVTLFVADQTGTMRYWNPASVQAARELLQKVSIPSDASYPQLLAHLRRLSRSLQQGKQ